MATVIINSKGQITIPKGVRAQLRLNAGDKISFVGGLDGSVRLVPINKPLSDLKGSVNQPKKLVSVEDMNTVISHKGGSSKSK